LEEADVGFAFLWSSQLREVRGGNMRRIAQTVLFGTFLLASAIGGLAQMASKDAHGSLVVVMKDGHRQTFYVADINKIEFKDGDIVVTKSGGPKSFRMSEVQSFEFDSSAVSSFAPGRNHFVGKWRVSETPEGGTFYITLEANGEAHKTVGGSHGTWTVVDGEARIAWDDGWHDAIRKVGTKHEKVAFEPGKSFSDDPSNVTDAVNTSPEPI
jgi:hypothetical protein